MGAAPKVGFLRKGNNRSEPKIMITPSLREYLVASALGVGFDLAGVAAVPERDSPEEKQQSERFAEWARAGFAGDMAWMLRADADGVPLRSSLQRAVPWAR